MKLTTISQFNGGIINGVASTKVDPTTASDLLDADIRYGDLRPVKGAAKASSRPKNWEYQNGRRSIVSFGNNAYWTDNETGDVGSTLGYMGVDWPKTLATATGIDRGSRFVGKYKYVCTFETAEGFESRPSTLGYLFNTMGETVVTDKGLEEISTYDGVKGAAQAFTPTNEASISPAQFGLTYKGGSQFIARDIVGEEQTVLGGSATYGYQREVTSPLAARGYSEGQIVSYKDKVYRAKINFFAMVEGTRSLYVNKGSKTIRYRPTGSRYYKQAELQIVEPLAEIQSWQYPDGSGGTEFWQVVGESDTIDPVDYGGYDTIEVSRLPSPEVVGGITTVNVYRTVGDGEVYFLAARLPVGTSSFRDNLSDEELVSGRELDFSPVAPPVYSVDGKGNALRLEPRFLTEQLEQFYVASGNRVYISDQGNPHRWDVRKFLQLDDECTGLARYRDGVLAFTANRTYQITGSTLADIRLRWIPEYQGCKDWRTIAYLNNNPTWISNDGLCQYGFVADIQAELLQTLTLGKYDWPEIVWGTVANKRYYGVTSHNEAVIYDFQRNGAISKVTIDAQFAEYDPDADVIVFKDLGGNDMALGTGDEKEWTYVSPQFTFDSNQLKRIRSCWVRCDEDLTILVAVDGVDRFTGESLFSVPYRRLFFPAGMTGTQFQFTLKSKGKLDQISIEWQEARKNG